MEKYKFELTKAMLDIVMKGLGELPLKESLPVFNEINAQFINQLAEEKKEAQPNAEESEQTIGG